MELNIPEVLAEVQSAFNAYENALNANDVEALIDFFWQDERAVRFGAAENLYGWEQIVLFRKEREAPKPRVLLNTVITCFGYHYANTSTEFKREDKIGRQSQSWVRTEHGWRIVAAHVSFLANSSN